MCKVGTIVTTFVSSGTFLVAIIVLKVCNWNCNHLCTSSNCNCRKKVHKIFFLTPLQTIIVLLINKIFLGSFENIK